MQWRQTRGQNKENSIAVNFTNSDFLIVSVKGNAIRRDDAARIYRRCCFRLVYETTVTGHKIKMSFRGVDSFT